MLGDDDGGIKEGGWLPAGDAAAKCQSCKKMVFSPPVSSVTRCVGEHRTEERTAEERAAAGCSLQAAACPLLARGLGHSRRVVRLYLILLNALLLGRRGRLLLLLPRSAIRCLCSPPPAPTRRRCCRMCRPVQCPLHSVSVVQCTSNTIFTYYMPCPPSVSLAVSSLSSLLSPVSTMRS